MFKDMLIGFEQRKSKHVFFPSFLLQVSTKNKALQDTSQAMGMKDKLVQQKSERYHFGYDSLNHSLSSNQVVLLDSHHGVEAFV